MKHKFGALAALFIAGMVSVTLFAVEVEEPVLKTKKISPARWCSLGTSITWYNSNVGFAGGRFTKGYQTRVLEQIKFKGGLVNKGVNGGVVASAIGAVEPADLYTIEHGINDWGHSTKPGTLTDYVKNTKNGTFAANYRQVIDKIRATNPNAKIILCTPRKGYGFNGYLPATADLAKNGIYLKDYVRVVNQIARKEGFVVADFFSTCGESAELKDLSIEVALHPNDAGYQRMANELVKAIMKVYPDLPDAPTTAEFTDDGVAKSVVYDKFLTGAPTVVLEGVDVNKVTVEAAKIGGSWIPGSPHDASVRFLRRNASEKTCRVQLQCVGGDKATRSLLVELAQDGSDVTARIVWGRYAWNWPVGTDFDKEGYDGGAGVATSYTSPGYGVGSITFGINKPDIETATAGEIKIAAIDVGVAEGELTFEKPLSGKPTIVLKGVKIDDVELADAEIIGKWVPGAPYATEIKCVKRSEGKMTCQAQIRREGEPPMTITRSIALEFVQEGDNVVGRVEWARWHKDWPMGTDFAKAGFGTAPVAADENGLGYGIQNLQFVRK